MVFAMDVYSSLDNRHEGTTDLPLCRRGMPLCYCTVMVYVKGTLAVNPVTEVVGHSKSEDAETAAFTSNISNHLYCYLCNTVGDRATLSTHSGHSRFVSCFL